MLRRRAVGATGMVGVVLAIAGLSCGGSRGVAGPAGQPTIRIGVAVGVGSVSLGGASGLTGMGEGGGRVRAAAGSALRAVAEGGSIRITGDGVSERYSSFVVRGNGAPVSVNGTGYRGDVEILARNGAVTAVNIVNLEDYVAGVVAVEMGTRQENEIAALRAQAVASRTYALKNRGKWASRGFDLAGSVSDQAYGGADAENPLTLRAVRETAGEVLTYRGNLVTAFYHSTCGFATAAPEEAFETVANAPYLRSVSDRNGDGYFCDISPHFRWVVEWSQAQLESTLRGTLERVLGIDPEDVTRVRALTAYTTGESGRLMELRIGVEGGEIPVIGPRIRQVLLGPDGRALKSTAIQFSTRTENGETVFRAAGAGYGHGVGMCQWGAIGRARAGQSYRSILSHYLPGTSIEEIY